MNETTEKLINWTVEITKASFEAETGANNPNHNLRPEIVSAFMKKVYETLSELSKKKS